MKGTWLVSSLSGPSVIYADVEKDDAIQQYFESGRGVSAPDVDTITVYRAERVESVVVERVRSTNIKRGP